MSTQPPPLAYFDAHNHIHLSIPGRIPPIISPADYASSKPTGATNDTPETLLVRKHAHAVRDNLCGSNERSRICGLSLMSTQPRDFIPVSILCDELSADPTSVASCVPCFGVHPWFLHLAEEDSNAYVDFESCVTNKSSFWWEHYMRKSLLDNPQSAVGEIGLDGARYDPKTGDLCTPMDRQVEAFETQLRLAVELQRPVSIHAVRAWGPLLDTLNKKFGKKKGDKPPRIYFHAFGGKAAQINQINAACRGTDEVFYGFAPCVNFRSPKTADVIRAIGIDSLVLESDRENYTAVREDLEANAQFIADALDMQKDDVVQKTAANARRFYGLA